MSNDWVPRNFNDMGNAGHDVDKVAEALLDETNQVFAPLGVDAAMNKKQVTKKAQSTKVCGGCNKPLDGRAVVALEKLWHPNCFECSQCAKPIEDGGFTLRDDKIWCPNCVKWSEDRQVGKAQTTQSKLKGKLGDSAAPEKAAAASKKATVEEKDFDTMRGFEHKICAKCSSKIQLGVDYNNKSFCAKCFTCGSCGNAIDPEQGFAAAGDSVMCPTCASTKFSTGKEESRKVTKCGGCKKVIEGKFLKVDGVAYHEDCFKCADCKGSLANGFAEVGKDKKKVCSDCSMKSAKISSEVVPMKEAIDGIRVDPRSGKVTKSEGLFPVVPQDYQFCPECGTKCGSTKFCSNCGFNLAQANSSRTLHA
jgi:hypothetical protein